MQKFSGTDYLKIDIASNYGLDKEPWEKRLAWFSLHEHCLMEMLATSDKPALYYAGVQAWFATQRGEPTGYPISLDATASGMQLLACLTGDRSAARLCNVVSTGSREDAYAAVYAHMLYKAGGTSKISREDCKRAVMTSLYGSKAVPKEVFGEDVLLHMFLGTMTELAPAAWELNEAFLAMWDPTTYTNNWVLPDNFHVKVKVMNRIIESVVFMDKPYEVMHSENAPTESGRSLGANTIHSLDGMVVREITRRCNYNINRINEVRGVLIGQPMFLEDEDHHVQMVLTLWEHFTKSGYLSARILDHIDSTTIMLTDSNVIRELVDSLPEKPFEVLSVHDCFRCLPNYGNDLRYQYNLQLHLIAKSELLSYLLSQLLKQTVSIGKLDPSLANDILATEYALS